MSIAIAVFIAYLGVRILIGAFNVLTDRAVNPAEALAQAYARARGRDCREIRTRGGGAVSSTSRARRR